MNKNTCVWTIRKKYISTECNVAVINRGRSPQAKSLCPLCGKEIESKIHAGFGY